ncbi:MAG: N-acetylmuramoyl-L-alanine amidase [Nocardioides sp.]
MTTENSAAPGPRRRDLLRAGGAAVAAGTVATVGVPRVAFAAPQDPRSRIVLRATEATGIRLAEVELAVRASPSGAAGPWTSDPLRADRFSLIGFSWPAHAPTPSLEVRHARGTAWTAWRPLPTLDDRPDAGDEAALRHATQPLWVGRADGVQVRVSGRRPATVTMSLIRSDAAARDRSLEGRRATTSRSRSPMMKRRSRSGEATRPAILTRVDWSANERMRDPNPRYIETIQQIHVHHTVSANDYTREETPALIRGMYYYHTQTLGWSDLGYNFLVDRFGRTWEGRAGGIAKAVRGAHTLGFNNTSAGVSVIGNFEQVAPSGEVVSAVAAVAAWKLARYGRDPQGTVTVVSEGSDKFSRNRAVTLPVIDGHRDTNDTACPGRFLYERLDDIRRAAGAAVGTAGPRKVTITSAFTIAGEPSPGSRLILNPGSYEPATATATYTWLRDGMPIRKATKAQRLLTDTDLGHLVSAVVTLSADGYQPVTQRVDLPEPVRSTPTLTLVTSTVRGRIKVALGVVAQGVDDPGGTAVVRVDTGTKEVTVAGGRASARFRRPAGGHTIEVTYSGSDRVRPGTARTTHST